MEITKAKINSKQDQVLALIKQELSKRIGSNSSYSLRAFARDIGVSPSSLSKVLSGKYAISKDFYFKLQQNLGLELDLFASEDHSSQSAEVRQLEAIHIEMISHWYFDVILELAGLNSVKLDIAFACQKLEISEIQAKLALETMEKLDLIERKSDHWVATDPELITTSLADIHITSYAARNLQEEILKQSIEKLNRIHIKRRSHTSMTLKFSIEDMDEAKTYIKEFRRNFQSKFESKDGDSVYQLQIGYFPYYIESSNSGGNNENS